MRPCMGEKDWMDGGRQAGMDGQTDRWTDGQMDGWMDGRVDACMCMYVWMDGWMDGANNRDLTAVRLARGGNGHGGKGGSTLQCSTHIIRFWKFKYGLPLLVQIVWIVSCAPPLTVLLASSFSTAIST